MSVEVWQNLPKAQDNPETIEEAIDRKIAEHEADATAHLGDNESLAAHRQSEVIDHMAESIVPDKFKSNTFLKERIASSFQSLTNYYSSGVSAQSLDALFVFASAGSNTWSYVAENLDNYFGTVFERDCSMVTNALISPSANCRVDLGIGDGSLQTDGQRCCFRHDGSKFWAVVEQVENYNSQKVEISGINVGEKHFYRIDFFAGDHVDFYIDDVLVASIDSGLPVNDGVSYFFASARNFSTGGGASVRFTTYVVFQDI